MSRASDLYDLLATPQTTDRVGKEAAIQVFLDDYDGNPANIDVDALGILNIFYPEPAGYPDPPTGEAPVPPYRGQILASYRLYTYQLLTFDNALPGRSRIKNIMTS